MGERIPRRMRWALAAMLAAAAMDLIDTTIVNVAAPAVRADLDAGDAQIEWAVAGYALAFGVGLITGGRLGDRFGRRPVFLAGVGGFVLTSLVSGLAPTADVLVGARVAQGAAAAVMIPQILTVIQVAVPAEQRSKTYPAYGATAAIGTVSGPLLGGVLVAADLFGLGWRAIFLINVPIGLAALAVTAATLPDSRAARADRLDLPGVTLLAAALVMVLLPLVEGPQLGWPAWTIWLLVAALPVFAAFVAHQRRQQARGHDPLVALELLRTRSIAGGLVTQLGLYAGVTGFFLVFALTLQNGHGFSALGTGVTLVAWSVGIAVASGVAGQLAPRLGRRLTTAGALLMAAGMGGLLVAAASSGPQISGPALVPGLLVAGLGMGAVAPTLIDVALRDVDPAHAGAASGIVTTSGQLGGAIGVAAAGAVYFATLGPTPGPADHTAALTAVLWYEIGLFVLVALLMRLLPQGRTARSYRGT